MIYFQSTGKEKILINLEIYTPASDHMKGRNNPERIYLLAVLKSSPLHGTLKQSLKTQVR